MAPGQELQIHDDTRKCGIPHQKFFFHPDYNCRSRSFTGSVRQLADSRTFTAGRGLHPALKNVFIKTEPLFCSDKGINFIYVQIAGRNLNSFQI